ncbi:rhodanese-like domain-containing protein [Gaetbulibacter aquiaggeris]|uniref:Rhodanese-like domain-containing protein n=1 Tax=Gaetbulibacter aquiaggeris TaxID=1735373 RepID=A0ABW7MRN9_9FLAO
MKVFISIALCFFTFYSNAQESLPELLKHYNTKNIPYITVQELAMPKTKAFILDAREKGEYNTSHLKNAIFVGYNNFELDSVIAKIPNKNSEIVVYCSIGIRSETIASKLKKAGYTNVFNLYGGIFEWKNNNFRVYNLENAETENVHVYSKEWGNWLKKGKKVF